MEETDGGRRDLATVQWLIAQEVRRQDEKWGYPRNHSDPIWLTILSEEVGEASEQMLECIFNGADRSELAEEVRQIAAVAFQWVDYFWRRGDYGRNPVLR